MVVVTIVTTNTYAAHGMVGLLQGLAGQLSAEGEASLRDTCRKGGLATLLWACVRLKLRVDASFASCVATSLNAAGLARWPASVSSSFRMSEMETRKHVSHGTTFGTLQQTY
jgi:hypothetical protein